MSRGAPYTREFLADVVRLEEGGMTLADIARRKGRAYKGLHRAVRAFQAGTWAPAGKHERTRQRRAEAERLVGSGITCVREIGRRIGVSEWGAHRVVRGIGLDREMRIELAKGTGI